MPSLSQSQSDFAHYRRELLGLSVLWLSVLGCNTSTKPTSESGVKESASISNTDTTAVATNKQSETTTDPPDSKYLKGTALAVEAATIRFEEAVETGIDFVREEDMRGKHRIFESTGGGVGIIDYDRDGRLDLFFPGGCRLPEEANSTKPTCVLYQHRGSVKFVDRTLESRLIQGGFCQGVTVGDFDNDGFDDLYVTAFGPNALFRNNGDGTFTDITKDTQTEVSVWSTSAAFADINCDGNLDLYVVNYLKENYENPTLCDNPRSPTGREQCPPSKFEGVDDQLFLNDGQGGFQNITDVCGLAGSNGKGMGVVVSDFDKNGKPEIYVSNDGQANFLFDVVATDSHCKLEEKALAAGAALSRSGYAQASMGIAAGDFDRDGLIDLHITNFYGDSNTLYKNLGDGRFVDQTRSVGIAGPSKGVLGWGNVFADFDDDGWLDLFVANGHVEDRTWSGLGEPFPMQQQVYKNDGKGKFVDVSSLSGKYFEKPRLGRGVAQGDFDQDGRLDLVISHQLEKPAILLNRSKSEPGFSVRLIGIKSNRNGWGAQVELLDSSRKIVAYRELTPGSSYESQGHSKLNFPSVTNGVLRVKWPSGNQQEHCIETPGQSLLTEKLSANSSH